MRKILKFYCYRIYIKLFHYALNIEIVSEFFNININFNYNWADTRSWHTEAHGI